MRSFGLMQDGTTVKIALLEGDKDHIKIVDLQTVKLPEADETVETQDTSFDTSLSGMDFDFDFPDGDNLGEEPSETKEDSTPLDLTEQPVESPAERTLETIARELDFANGTVSMNLDISNVAYKEASIPKKAGKKKINAELKKLFFDETTPSVMTLTHMQRSDGSYVGIGHEGKMDLLENLIHINRSLSKKRYHYSYIQSNEIPLINAVRFNHSVKTEDISAIIYIGIDSSRVTLLKGYDFYSELPIINEGYLSSDIIKTVHSRVRLEASHLNISKIDNYFIAGDGLNDLMLETITESQNDARVEFLLPLKLSEMTDYSGVYDEQTLAAYIVPIMLAVTAVMTKDTGLIRSNFLPKQLREQQNILSISTEGFAVLGLILIVSLFSINNILRQRTENRAIELEMRQTRAQIDVTRTRLDSLVIIRNEIGRIETNISRSNLLIGNRNQWHFIMERISNMFNRNRISWLNSIQNEQDGFRIIGNTTNRINIIRLSELFPNARVQYINEEKIQDHTIWNFEIVFGMPDPLETKRMNFIRESQFRNYSLPNHHNSVSGSGNISKRNNNQEASGTDETGKPAENVFSVD